MSEWDSGTLRGSGPGDNRVREYELHALLRRWSWYPDWLPFGRVYVVMSKETTWGDVFGMANILAENGALQVGIDWNQEG